VISNIKRAHREKQYDITITRGDRKNHATHTKVVTDCCNPTQFDWINKHTIFGVTTQQPTQGHHAATRSHQSVSCLHTVEMQRSLSHTFNECLLSNITCRLILTYLGRLRFEILFPIALCQRSRRYPVNRFRHYIKFSPGCNKYEESNRRKQRWMRWKFPKFKVTLFFISMRCSFRRTEHASGMCCATLWSPCMISLRKSYKQHSNIYDIFSTGLYKIFGD
jgi:hypothetical protein